MFAPYESSRRDIGQLMTLTPVLYLDPMTRSAPSSAVWMRSSRNLGSWEKSASVSKMRS